MAKHVIYCLLAILCLLLKTSTQSTLNNNKSNAETKNNTNKNTDINICGLSPSTCPKSRYRSYDGSCNNLKKPNWGTPQSPYGHLVRNNYADGINAWPQASDGSPLPNSREISLKIFVPKDAVEHIYNLNTQQWGQVITHDMSLTGGVEVLNRSSPICCDINSQQAPDANTDPLCNPILIPENDFVHVSEGKQCMNFVRTVSSKDKGCTSPNVPAIPLSVVTAYMDLSLTYGSSEVEAASLREGTGGRLLTTVRNGQHWPPQVSNTRQICGGARSSDEPCYLFGDSRGNQSPQLAVLQIILVREHNRIADALSKLNPHWNDEIVFQEARRICIAIIQRINYYEYLIILLGKKNMIDKKLIYDMIYAKDYVNDYNSSVNPAVLNEHATAAFRHFHTLIRGQLELINQYRKLVGTVRLSDWFNRPSLLETLNGFNDLTRGLSYQAADKSDQYWDLEITRNLFKGNRTSGGDLRATDIQRGRDHGLAPYVALREFCGLSVPKKFSCLNAYMSKENVKILKSLYKKPEDIDLVVGGSLEEHAPGALVGPTFLCILLKQFYNTRVSDRYFFENGADKNIAFTKIQLESIRQGSNMARLLCDNGHNIEWMQPKAFEMVTDKNRLVRCDELPSVNLTLWKETI